MPEGAVVTFESNVETSLGASGRVASLSLTYYSLFQFQFNFIYLNSVFAIKVVFRHFTETEGLAPNNQ